MLVVKQKVEKYQCSIEPFSRLTDEVFKEYCQRRPEVQKKTEVFIRSNNSKIAYIGEPANIQEAKKEMQEIFEMKKTQKKEIKIPEGYTQWLMQYKDQLKTLAT